MEMQNAVCDSLLSSGDCFFFFAFRGATYIEIVEFCFCLKEKLINEQFRIHVKQSSLHTRKKKKSTKTKLKGKRQ